jgi:hypothetical protein
MLWLLMRLLLHILRKMRLRRFLLLFESTRLTWAAVLLHEPIPYIHWHVFNGRTWTAWHLALGLLLASLLTRTLRTHHLPLPLLLLHLLGVGHTTRHTTIRSTGYNGRGLRRIHMR